MQAEAGKRRSGASGGNYGMITLVLMTMKICRPVPLADRVFNRVWSFTGPGQEMGLMCGKKKSEGHEEPPQVNR